MPKKQSNNEPTTTEPDPELSTQNEEPMPDDDKFKVTIKKLDKVVHPRGVLAE